MTCWSQCKHVRVKVQHQTVNGAPVTYILYRCGRCDDVYSEELDGTWSWKDLRRETADDGTPVQ